MKASSPSCAIVVFLLANTFAPYVIAQKRRRRGYLNVFNIKDSVEKSHLIYRMVPIYSGVTKLKTIPTCLLIMKVYIYISLELFCSLKPTLPS